MAVADSLSALQEQERTLREQIEAMQRQVAEAPRKLEETRRLQAERDAENRRARAEAERGSFVFDQPRAAASPRSAGPRRAVKLKVEQRTMKQQTWALVLFLLLVIFMLWSALT